MNLTSKITKHVSPKQVEKDPKSMMDVILLWSCLPKQKKLPKCQKSVSKHFKTLPKPSITVPERLYDDSERPNTVVKDFGSILKASFREYPFNTLFFA